LNKLTELHHQQKQCSAAWSVADPGCWQGEEASWVAEAWNHEGVESEKHRATTSKDPLCTWKCAFWWNFMTF